MNRRDSSQVLSCPPSQVLCDLEGLYKDCSDSVFWDFHLFVHEGYNNVYLVTMLQDFLRHNSNFYYTNVLSNTIEELSNVSETKINDSTVFNKYINKAVQFYMLFKFVNEQDFYEEFLKTTISLIRMSEGYYYEQRLQGGGCCSV